MNTTDQIIAIIARAAKVPAETLSADSSMETVPEWDSLAQLNICLELQERFGVQLGMDQIADASSVRALAEIASSARR